jgi:hypothetical protein
MITLANLERHLPIVQGGIKMEEGWFKKTVDEVIEEKKEVKLINNFDVLIATNEHENKTVQKDRDTYNEGIIPILEDMGIAEDRDTNHLGSVQIVEDSITGRFGTTTIAKEMENLIADIKNLNRVQGAYIERLIVCLERKEILLNSPVAMIQRLKRYGAAELDEEISIEGKKGIILQRLGEGNSQREIANELGVTQPYVSKIKLEFEKERKRRYKMGNMGGNITSHNNITNIDENITNNKCDKEGESEPPTQIGKNEPPLTEKPYSPTTEINEGDDEDALDN